MPGLERRRCCRSLPAVEVEWYDSDRLLGRIIHKYCREAAETEAGVVSRKAHSAMNKARHVCAGEMVSPAVS